jgi:UDP-glucose 4-epimerase
LGQCIMILVFGAGGFIGTYLVDRLITDNKEVVASDFNEFGESYYCERQLPYHCIDITRKEDFAHLPRENIEAVIHLACAQPANISDPERSPQDYVNVNVVGTLNILEFCRVNRIPKIIYTCSHRNTQGMWANKAGRPISEDDGRAIKFTGEYAMFSISESAATDCVECYAKTYGIEGVVLRLPPVYGYGPHTEIFKEGKPLKTGLQIFIENAEQGRPIVLWGDPENGRDIVYVKDVVSAICLALGKSDISGIYNISSGRRLSLREQAESIIRVFCPSDMLSEIRHEPDRANFVENYVYAIDKAKLVLGWEPKYSFEDMLLDYQKERAAGRFSYLVKKRKDQLQKAAAQLVTSDK